MPSEKGRIALSPPDGRIRRTYFGGSGPVAQDGYVRNCAATTTSPFPGLFAIQDDYLIAVPWENMTCSYRVIRIFGMR